MCAPTEVKESHIFQKLVRRSEKVACLCAGLLITAAVNASTHISVIDSFDAADDLLGTTPRSISAPGTDFTQINSLNGSATAERLIGLDSGGLLLTGTTLDMPGDSSASITVTYETEVDWTVGGATAFDIHFSLTGGTEVDLAVRVTTATGSCDYSALTFLGDGAHKAYFNFFAIPECDYTAVDNFSVFADTVGAQNTFSLDAIGTTVALVPVPSAFWLFGSALGLLGSKRRARPFHAGQSAR